MVVGEPFGKTPDLGFDERRVGVFPLNESNQF
jgi:hypothetical protein